MRIALQHLRRHPAGDRLQSRVQNACCSHFRNHCVTKIVETAFNAGNPATGRPRAFHLSHRFGWIKVPDRSRTMEMTLFPIKAVTLGGEDVMFRLRVRETRAPFHQDVVRFLIEGYNAPFAAARFRFPNGDRAADEMGARHKSGITRRGESPNSLQIGR